jgi:hypothetical protein
MGTWDQKVEQRTLVTADNHRELWDDDDLAFVAAFRDDATNEELAVTLGRSLFAITSIKQVLDERIAKQVAERRRAQRPSQRAYTFIDGDVPPGWW